MSNDNKSTGILWNTKFKNPDRAVQRVLDETENKPFEKRYMEILGSLVNTKNINVENRKIDGKDFVVLSHDGLPFDNDDIGRFIYLSGTDDTRNLKGASHSGFGLRSEMACASKVEGNIRTFDIDYFCENPFEYAFIVTKIKEKLKISVEGELNVDVGDKWLIMAMSNNGKETIQLANVIGSINDTPRKKINDYIDKHPNQNVFFFFPNLKTDNIALGQLMKLIKSKKTNGDIEQGIKLRNSLRFIFNYHDNLTYKINGINILSEKPGKILDSTYNSPYIHIKLELFEYNRKTIARCTFLDFNEKCRKDSNYLIKNKPFYIKLPGKGPKIKKELFVEELLSEKTNANNKNLRKIPFEKFIDDENYENVKIRSTYIIDLATPAYGNIPAYYGENLKKSGFILKKRNEIFATQFQKPGNKPECIPIGKDRSEIKKDETKDTKYVYKAKQLFQCVIDETNVEKRDSLFNITKIRTETKLKERKDGKNGRTPQSMIPYFLVSVVREFMWERSGKVNPAKRKLTDEEKTNKKIKELEKKNEEKEKARIAAEKKAEENEKGRIAAEKKVEEKEKERIAAEKKAKEKEKERIAAENKAEEKEKERIAAEKKTEEKEKERITAEKKAEEKEKERIAAEKKAEEKEKERIAAEKKAEEKEKERITAEKEAEKQRNEKEEERKAKIAAENETIKVKKEADIKNNQNRIEYNEKQNEIDQLKDKYEEDKKKWSNQGNTKLVSKLYSKQYKNQPVTAECPLCEGDYDIFSERHSSHILAKIHGGENTEENLVLLCQSCNSNMKDTNMMVYAKKRFKKRYPSFREKLIGWGKEIGDY